MDETVSSMMASARRLVSDPEIAVVVLNWNGWRDTVACLESLHRLAPPNHHVIVVDNGSTDDSITRIRAAAPEVIIVETRANRGFAGGANVGIRHALDGGAGSVWLLNNDTVVTPGSLAAMSEAMNERPDVGIVGSVVRPLDRRDRIEAWGGGTVNRCLGTTRRYTRPDAGRLDYVAGTSMLIRREVFEDVGLLDEDFFFYLEDVDFCRRAVAAGWTLVVAPRATVFHKGGATVNDGARRRSARADHHHTRSSGIFIRKHAGRWLIPSASLRLAGIAVRRLIRGQARRIPAASREFIRGLATGVRHG